ncbi:MAG: DUF374 domain-containing protein [Puniceicoccales bacterium]|jgi:lysophospholipid acyltransferase (LPLAT)-like uncharacterized protein|nr:DUF374 domain-containing protein [Puniceicoccales bacterium]
MQKEKYAHRLSPIQRLCLMPFVWFLRLWLKSLRLYGTAQLEAILYGESSPKVFTFWHNRLFPVARLHGMYRGTRSIYGLISPSKDGAWLSGIYEQLGISSLRGSSQRDGQHALRNSISAIRNGASIAITPDGPRGPRYVFKPGALWLSRETRTSLVVVGIHFHHALRLRTWDEFYLPLPFSRTSIDAKILPTGTPLGSREKSSLHTFQKALFDINHRQHFQSLERNGQLHPL